MKCNILGKEYQIIDNINDLTFEQYQKISKIKFTDIDEYIISILEVLLGIGNEILLDIKYQEYIRIQEHLTILMSQKVEKNEINTITIKGVNYKIHSGDDWKVKHWIDCNFYSSQSVEDNIHRLIAIMLLKEYTIEQLESLANDILQLKCSEVFGLFEYFLKKKQTLSKGMIQYLKYLIPVKIKQTTRYLKKLYRKLIHHIHSIQLSIL